jgi:hypothetical protein
MHKNDQTKVNHINHSPDMDECQAITYKYKPPLLVTWTKNVQVRIHATFFTRFIRLTYIKSKFLVKTILGSFNKQATPFNTRPEFCKDSTATKHSQGTGP